MCSQIPLDLQIGQILCNGLVGRHIVWIRTDKPDTAGAKRGFRFADGEGIIRWSFPCFGVECDITGIGSAAAANGPDPDDRGEIDDFAVNVMYLHVPAKMLAGKHD